jgi:CubicO group peptidase (beta-lactamase class C family)
LTDKIWKPFGMENQASWLLSSDGREISGCCIQASLRDFARYGLFVLEDGKIKGTATLPDGWFEMATSKQADIGSSGKGYGYQWWTFDDGSFTARGIFGQTIFIDPKRQLVVALNGNWENATEAELNKQRFEFIDRVRGIIDQQD